MPSFLAMDEFSVKIQWFPGHMTKARRKIEQSLKQVDLAIEILDARAPMASANPVLKKLIGNKPHMVLLNKQDLADPTQTARWISVLRDRKITAIAVDSRSGKNIKEVLSQARRILQPKIAGWEKKGMVGRPVRLMVVGIPNVGKSAFINRLCLGGGAGKAEVQDRPGITRQNRWFTIGKGFELMDTPGVLWPKFEDPAVGEILAFTGAVKDEVVDQVALAARLIVFLRNLYPGALERRYRLEEEAEEALPGAAVLEKIARRRGMLVAGGEIDLERAAAAVLDEFRAAKIGRITLEWAKAEKNRDESAGPNEKAQKRVE